VLAALTATVLLVPSPTPVAALTSPLGMTTVGHSDLGTVLTSTTDFTYEGRLDLVDDDGTRLFSRTLPDDPALQGVSRQRYLSFCADTVTSLNAVYDQDTGTTDNHVIWYSLLGNRTATGTVDLGADENYLTSAPGGWVTTTSDTEAGTTAVTFHGTDGSSRSLGSLDHTGASEPVCDEESVVVTASTYPSSVSIVRIPFDGSGPVELRAESMEADPAPWLRALSVDGDDVIGTVTPQQGWEPSPVGRIEVWHHDGATTTPLVTAPEGSRVEGGAVGPDGVLVCLSHPDLSGGCDGRFFPTSGTATQGELPESGLFWPTPDGFLQGCTGTNGSCVHLYAITVPDLDVSTLYRGRQPLDIGRWGGADRYAVAAKVSAESFSPGGVVFLASGTGFADALSVGAQGARMGGPTLLTTRDRMPAATEAELRRLTPWRIWVVGGTGAVSEAVYTKAAALGQHVERIDGADRYAVAAAVSKRFYTEGWETAFVVSGENYPDGLVAAAPAARNEAPILLTRAGSLPATTRAELKRLGASHVVVIGGTGSVSASVVSALEEAVGDGGDVRRVSGSDRYRTATAVAREFYPDRDGGSVFLATGADFPDALAVGPATRGYGPLLLTGRYTLPSTTADELQRLAPGYVRVAGGPAVVDGSVLTQIVKLPDIP
jgi:putative cell wall-binding protein